MSIQPQVDHWMEANHEYLMASVQEVRSLLGKVPIRSWQGEEPSWPEDLAPPALDRLCRVFSLTPFERRLIALCAGVELDGSLGDLCGPTRCPTPGLALAAFPDAELGAFLPDSPLRYWQLIRFQDGPYLNSRSMALDERILHFLSGFAAMDPFLVHQLTPRPVGLDSLVASQRRAVESIAGGWSQASEGPVPVAQLCGPEAADKLMIAGGLADLLELELWSLDAISLPTSPEDTARLLLHLRRELLLRPAILLMDCDHLDAEDRTWSTVEYLLGHIRAPILVTVEEKRAWKRRAVLSFEVGRPEPAEQVELWQRVLGSDAEGLDATLEQIVDQFDLSALKIQAVVAQSLGDQALVAGDEQAESLGSVLWRTCRAQARPRLENRAQLIEPRAGWEDLVLPDSARYLLLEILNQVRWRKRVYDDWGFAGRSRRGLGIAALFAGTSGTGKTLAAEVLAGELGLDLYRIDLSTVVSKYIGETEKNLERIFLTAEEAGAVLLFDEADALFGKRTEVSDSHDRHANVEVSYLLQRMETYRGLALLTSNLKDSIDQAFLRRFRFVVDFPFPDADQRARIWRRLMPAEAPIVDFDPEGLATLPLTGGSIRNVAMNAAFFAAEDHRPLTMDDLARAAERELGKLGRTVSVRNLMPTGSGD